MSWCTTYLIVHCDATARWFRVGAQVCTWGCSSLTPQPFSACITDCSLWHQCSLCQLSSMRVLFATRTSPGQNRVQSPAVAVSALIGAWWQVRLQSLHCQNSCGTAGGAATSTSSNPAHVPATRVIGSKHHPGTPLCQAAKLSETPYASK
jgi:hypothetical protein